jgi:hypothetical protein
MSKVNHPKHYQSGDPTYETINVIEAWGLDFCLGNVVKYISRAGKKNSELEDLEKASWYLNRKINQIKSNDTNQTHTQDGSAEDRHAEKGQTERRVYPTFNRVERTPESGC